MVEPDRDIARRDQRLLRGLGLLHAGHRARKLHLGDRLLLRLHPGHVRVAEDRDAVGAHCGGESGAGRDMRAVLARQAVHQVEVDRADPGAPQPPDRRLHLRFRLDAADPRLHRGVHVLHAKARAGEALRRQHRHHLRVEGARVELHRELGIGSDGESARAANPARSPGRAPRSPMACRRRDAARRPADAPAAAAASSPASPPAPRHSARAWSGCG
jgi:hypothetical protein